MQRVLDLPRRHGDSPTPRRRRRPRATLDGFLFDAKQGYCQQYSGAMALLLRMGGIPARVATGFSTGATDTKTGEYVVRDFDAHSWVEVYYPDYRLGDVRPDARRLARALASRADAVTPAARAAGAALTPRRPVSERGAGVAVAAESRPWWHYALSCWRCSPLAALGFSASRRWRRGAPPALTELERALKRTRREPRPGPRCTRSSSASRARPRPRATCARCARALPRRAEPAHPRAAPRPAFRARTRQRHARPLARLVGPPAQR